MTRLPCCLLYVLLAKVSSEFFVEKQMVLPTREMSLSLLREISLLENIPLNINKSSSSPVLCTCTLSPSWFCSVIPSKEWCGGNVSWFWFRLSLRSSSVNRILRAWCGPRRRGSGGAHCTGQSSLSLSSIHSEMWNFRLIDLKSSRERGNFF